MAKFIMQQFEKCKITIMLYFINVKIKKDILEEMGEKFD